MKLPALLLILLTTFLSYSQAFASSYDNTTAWGQQVHGYDAYAGENCYFDFNTFSEICSPYTTSYSVDYTQLNNSYNFAGTGGPPTFPNDPTAYYQGFDIGSAITFSVRITNNGSDTGLDNYSFNINRLNSCNGNNLNQAGISENSLYQCSLQVSFTNQSIVYSNPSPSFHDNSCGDSSLNGKYCHSISPNSNWTFSNTWTPTSPGYYQFDFNSDDVNPHTFAAGYIYVKPAPTSTPTPTFTPTPTNTPTPTPLPVPPTPQVATPLCLSGALTNPDNSISIRWPAGTNPAISWVDISPNQNFTPYYHKAISNSSTTAPNGFNCFVHGSCSLQGGDQLVIISSQNYYVRLYNGYLDGNTQSFVIPACPTPTPLPPAYLQTHNGDVHQNQ